MRKIKFICFFNFLFITAGFLHAQSRDTITTKKIIDKGSKGDIILGEKHKKDQLDEAPVLLHPQDSICKKNSTRTSKKIRRKQIKKGS